MPFVVARANVPISTEQEVALKERLGRAIAHMPGKSEAGLLLAFEGNARLWLAGGDEPLAYIETSVFANEGHAGYEAFASDVAAALQEVLGIPAGRVYVRFSDIPVWSVNDMAVDRRLYS